VSSTAIVVGGGIVGAACAAELVDAGVRVVLLEAAPRLAGGATAAGMGHIIILDDSEIEFELTHLSQRLWDELATALPRAAQVDPCGVLWLASDAQELEAARRKASFMSDRGLPTELLDERALYDAEPRLRPGMAGGLLLPLDSVLYPPACVRWLLERAAADGDLSIRTGVTVRAMGDGTVTTDAGEILEADWVVNAAGHDGLALLPTPLPALTIRPRKGHLAITARAPGFIRHQLIELGYITSAHGHDPVSVAFNLQPRATGQMLIGSSRQYGVNDTAVDPQILSRMLGKAVSFVPELKSIPVVRAWTGFRAATEDKLPIIGPAPGLPRLLLATGHEGLGITTSLVTGRLIRAMVTGEDPILDPTPFSPARSARRAA
jgi:glycine/D-amino acid oxidase-like deaminating enzyme